MRPPPLRRDRLRARAFEEATVAEAEVKGRRSEEAREAKEARALEKAATAAAARLAEKRQSREEEGLRGFGEQLEAPAAAVAAGSNAAATEEEAAEAATVFAQQVSMVERTSREQNGLYANGMVSAECRCV